MSQVLKEAELCIEMVKITKMIIAYLFFVGLSEGVDAILNNHFLNLHAYNASKNILLSNFVKLERLATHFIQLLCFIVIHERASGFQHEQYLASGSCCNSESETVLHCFKDCLDAASIWAMLDSSILDFPSGMNFNSWIREKLKD
ncbi:hypothetical protein PIB30_050892 [Stylosanthes scabra]|uniref:Uncharacterized protein n=1 Tax=Stylosanthes scabra TaxID=79078 RepID=A0ABU6WFZ7_9FABA|nr:hypothetical protein [Stylosanthes scabra]